MGCAATKLGFRGAWGSFWLCASLPTWVLQKWLLERPWETPKAANSDANSQERLESSGIQSSDVNSSEAPADSLPKSPSWLGPAMFSMASVILAIVLYFRMHRRRCRSNRKQVDKPEPCDRVKVVVEKA